MAEMQRMKDMARFQQELEQRKGMEDELRRQADKAAMATSGPTDVELVREVENLRRKSMKQEAELGK